MVDAFNLITVFLVVILKYTLAGVLLVMTRRWTWLGRGLLLMFLLMGTAFGVPLLLRFLGTTTPAWFYDGLRVLFIIDSIAILAGLARYDWPERPDQIQWESLLGLRRTPKRAVPPAEQDEP